MFSMWIVFIIAAEAVPVNGAPMTEVTGLLKILQDYGVGGLFFAMYLTTVYAYRKTMMEYVDKAESKAVMVTAALERSTAAIEAGVISQREVKAELSNLRLELRGTK